MEAIDSIQFLWSKIPDNQTESNDIVPVKYQLITIKIARAILHRQINCLSGTKKDFIYLKKNLSLDPANIQDLAMLEQGIKSALIRSELRKYDSHWSNFQQKIVFSKDNFFKKKSEIFDIAITSGLLSFIILIGFYLFMNWWNNIQETSLRQEQ